MTHTDTRWSRPRPRLGFREPVRTRSAKPNGKKPRAKQHTKTKPRPHRAAAPPDPVSISAVVSRTLTYSGDIVALRIPAGARKHLLSAGKLVECWQFTRPLDGGFVNIYVYGDHANDIRRSRVIARAALWQETLPDGRSYPAIHVRLVDAKPTHSLYVMKEAELPARYRKARMFSAEPFAGHVVYLGRTD